MKKFVIIALKFAIIVTIPITVHTVKHLLAIHLNDSLKLNQLDTNLSTLQNINVSSNTTSA